MTHIVSRREACLYAAIATAACILAPGCTKSSDKQGFSTDTVIRDYPVDLTIYVDSQMLDAPGITGAQQLLDEMISRYRSQANRGDVSVAVVPLHYSELKAILLGQGFETGDAVITESGLISQAESAKTVDTSKGVSTRTFGLNFPLNVVVARSAQRSDVEMPAARTANGEDAADGSVTRMHNIGAVEGKIALVNPENEIIGIAANKLLYRAGLYSSETGVGGTFTADLQDKVIVYDSMDAAAEGVALGECDLCFAFDSSLRAKYQQLEKCYTPSGGTTTLLAGASLPCSKEPGVARDFLQYLTL